MLYVFLLLYQLSIPLSPSSSETPIIAIRPVINPVRAFHIFKRQEESHISHFKSKPKND